jgi:hypothetical protein
MQFTEKQVVTAKMNGNDLIFMPALFPHQTHSRTMSLWIDESIITGSPQLSRTQPPLSRIH